MNLNVYEDKLHVRTFLSPCACSCKFCCLHKKEQKMISFEDYEYVLRKYAKKISDYNMRLRTFVYNRPDEKYISKQMKLYKELDLVPDEYTRLDMNGIPMLDDERRYDWFQLLKNSGVTFSMYSWFGLEQSHDEFVQRKGYFSFQRKCIETSKNAGIGVKNKIFLRKSNLSEVEELVNILEKESEFLQCVFMEYAGGAIELEKEFLTIEDVNNLSDKIINLIEKPYFSKFKTEREWVELAIKDEFPEFRIVDYILILNPDNIDYYKNSELEEVIDGFRKLNLDLYRKIGSLKDLADTYGDKNGLILYDCRDVIRKWLDKSLQKNGERYEDYFGPDKTCVEWKVYEKMH